MRILFAHFFERWINPFGTACGVQRKFTGLPLVALLCAAAVCVVSTAVAQTPPPPAKPCTATEARQFDFWVGAWTGRFADASGKMVNGSNTVSTLYDGCVIVEQFDGAPGSPLKGMSHSVYDANARRWKQTWVDNSGGYLDFVGGWEGERMILSREAERNDKRFQQRMVWFDITKDAFNWHWERSDDGGKTWKVNWRIEYRRR